MRDAPDCFASVVAMPRMPPRPNFLTPSTRRHSAPAHAGDAVVLGQRLVEERVVGVEDVEHRAVALEEVGEEPDRFLVHRAAEADEGREVPLALLVERVEVVDVQPLAGELGRQAADLVVLEHPPRLGREHLGVAQSAARRRARRASRRAPTTRGSNSAGWPVPSPTPAPASSPARPSRPGRGSRRDQDPGQRQPEGVVVRQLLAAQLAVEARAARLASAPVKRTAIGPGGEVEHASSCFGSASTSAWRKAAARVVDRLAKRLEELRVAVLRGVFHELSKASTSVSASWLTNCSSSQSRSSRAVWARRASAGEVVVLAIEERERHDLVDRHDLRVAKRGGEQLAEVVEGRLEPLPRGAALGANTGSVGLAKSLRIAGRLVDADRLRSCTLPAASRLEQCRARPVRSSARVGREPELDDRWGLHAEARRRRLRLLPLGCRPNSAGSRPQSLPSA